MRATDEQQNDTPTPSDDRRWFRIYTAVIIFTVFVIIALWIFSRLFA